MYIKRIFSKNLQEIMKENNMYMYSSIDVPSDTCSIRGLSLQLSDPAFYIEDFQISIHESELEIWVGLGPKVYQSCLLRVELIKIAHRRTYTYRL